IQPRSPVPFKVKAPKPWRGRRTQLAERTDDDLIRYHGSAAIRALPEAHYRAALSSLVTTAQGRPPTDASLLAMMWQLNLTGFSDSEIADYLREDRFPTPGRAPTWLTPHVRAALGREVLSWLRVGFMRAGTRGASGAS